MPADLAQLRDSVASFVREQVVPFEADPRISEHGPDDDLRDELVELARGAGLLTPQAPAQWGGRGLSHVEQAVVFEAAGWSTLGPVAMNCAAPDEGNMYLLERIARPDQVEEHLVPMVAGRTRSAFAMTEPGGAGSDPGQLLTRAVFDGSSYRIDGRKWLITGAVGATTWIIMARVAPNEHGPDGPTLFLAPAGTPGIEVERVMHCIDRNSVGGHSVVSLTDVRLPAAAVLGEVGGALQHAQLRLAPARLTHCMRWLGAASRAQSVALEHARTRTSFGLRLGEHQGVSFMLAENEIVLQQCRLAIWHAAWLLDQGEKARHESSMVKVFVSEELFKVADRCVQILGGMGVSEETPVQTIFRDLRAFRIYDGPTEVHKFAIGRRLVGRTVS